MNPIDISFDLTRQQVIRDNGSRGIGHRHAHGYWDPEGPRKRALKQRARFMGLSMRHRLHLPVPLAPRVHVTVYVAYPKGTGRADPGNLSHTVKPLIDGLTDAGWWADDDSRHLTGPDYRREANDDGIPVNNAVPGIWTVRIRVEEES